MHTVHEIGMTFAKTNLATMQTLCEQPIRLPPAFDSPSLLLVRAPQPYAPYTWCPWRFVLLDVKQTVRRTLEEWRELVISESE